MIKRSLRLIIIVLIVGAVFYFNGGLDKLMKTPTVEAFGDLLVNFNVPPGNPIFNLTNMKPGDFESKPVDVTNNGSVNRFILVKGVRTGGIGDVPKLESALGVVIKDGTTPLYGNGSSTGPRTMSDFFADSAGTDGIPLNIVPIGGAKTYNFLVDFPSTAGNLFQAKSVIADLTFGVRTGDNIVINEVFYNVDEKHSLRENRGRGAADINTGLKFQWIELYNPTDHVISLKNWRIYNETGKSFDIHPNKKLKAGQFALLSHDGSLWRFWNNVAGGALRIEIGAHFARGLDIDGDVLILKNPSGAEIDRMSWGDNTSGFTPPAANPKVERGHSTERQVPGFDNDVASDFINRSSPSPGN